MLDEAALDRAEEQWLIIRAFDLGSRLTDIAEGKRPLLEAGEPRGARCRCQDAQNFTPFDALSCQLTSPVDYNHVKQQFERPLS
jgi:hypothetical protein